MLLIFRKKLDLIRPLHVNFFVQRLLKNLWGNRRIGWRLARMSMMFCAGLVIVVTMFEDRFIYYPVKYPEGEWDVSNPPAREGQIVPVIEDCYFITGDGLKLHGWYCIPQKKSGHELTPVSAEMVLLWFHGNAGNITDRYDMIRTLMQVPMKILIIDYRGYGKSEGSPTERGLYADARAAWDYLSTERGVRTENIIILGKSLGGGPAIDLATKVQPAGLIVQSSFTSIPDMAGSVIPLFPGMLLRTKMDSINKVGWVSCPKLFIHSPADELVPFEMGRRLYDAAAEPKRFYEVPGAPHNSTWMVGGKAYLEEIRSFVKSCAPAHK
jgi:hypothetical protein